MIAELLELDEIQTPLYPPRKRWTRVECESLEATGLWDCEQLELIDGELISRMGKKRLHVTVLALVQKWLIVIFGGNFVNVEAPIDVAPEDNPTNEPQPDLLVLKKPTWTNKGNPQPGDIRLLIEVSDTTLAFDMRTKARLYARAGIVEYWVVDAVGRRVIVHRQPGAGRYADIVWFTEGENVSIAGQELVVRDAFPPQETLDQG